MERVGPWIALVAGWVIIWVMMSIPVLAFVVVVSLPMFVLAISLGVSGLRGLHGRISHFWIFTIGQLVCGYAIGLILGEIFSPGFRFID
jgi:hypothetical protein